MRFYFLFNVQRVMFQQRRLIIKIFDVKNCEIAGKEFVEKSATDATRKREKECARYLEHPV